MADLVTEIFNKGVYNLVDSQNIPQEAASDALGWISTDDRVELSRGRKLQGFEKNYRQNQSQSRQTTNFAFGQKDEVGKQNKVAQSFVTIEESSELEKQKLDGILLYKRADTGTTTGSVTVEIQTDSSGNPTGTVLATKTISTEEWNRFGVGYIPFIFSSQIELEKQSRYWIVVTSSGADNNNHMNLGGMATSVYADGVAKYSNSTEGWTTLLGDLAFKTLEESLGEGGITGHHTSYKVDSTAVFFRKAGTSIQYFDNNAQMWIDVVTGLTEANKISFADDASLAGNAVYAGGRDGLWKIVVANPQDAADVYDEAKNFKGRILIDRSRMLLWDREQDRTGLYGSKINPQDGSVYTTVASESLGASGSKTYAGTLAFKAGGAKRSCFGVAISANYLDGTTTKTETFSDDYSGNLTGDQGGTGKINYMTGDYEVTFKNTTTSGPSAEYQWEDPTNGGIADFTKSSPRLASEGFIFRQDFGGDEILQVLVQDGKYISLKRRSSYELTISDDDESASNLPFRLDVGIPTGTAAINATAGIVFINTANPDNPVLTTLQRVSSAAVLEPILIAPQFDFSKYNWDDTYMQTYGEYVAIACKEVGAKRNNRILLFNPRLNIIDVLPYNAHTMVKADGVLYVGSSVNYSCSAILSGFDDDGQVVENFWIGRGELFETQNLKKIKRLRFEGAMSREQKLKISVSYDNGPFQHVGTILGDGPYVDGGDRYTIGSVGIGTSTIGGNSVNGQNEASPFRVEVKLTKVPKFKKRELKIEATGIGHAEIRQITDFDIWVYENRLTPKYRLKQNVSLDGESTDQ